MSWIMTYTGKRIDPLNPDPEQICIEDIAHALSNICRFNGHVKQFYPVASHALLCVAGFLEYECFCSDLKSLGELDAQKALALLLHDASEAYLCDVPKPIKPHMPGYAELEDRLQRVINVKYGLAPDAHLAPCVKHVDKRVLVTEALSLMPKSPGYCDGAEPYAKFVSFADGPNTNIDIQETEDTFLMVFKRLQALLHTEITHE
jgi:uncharacterized protein